MMRAALRKSSSIHLNRALAGAVTSIGTAAPSFQIPCSCSSGSESGGFSLFQRLEKSSGFGSAKEFHAASGPLNFRASTVTEAEFAVDYSSYDDDKPLKGGKSGEEGLDVAKLGIAEEIVSALAKRGISSLFPIQVAFPILLTLV